jgi:hypothetical protein
MPKEKDEQFSEEEAIKRREAALRRLLATPHQPHKSIEKNKNSPRERKPVKKPGQ